MAKKNSYWAGKSSEDTIEHLQKYACGDIEDSYSNLLERNNKYYYNFNTYDDAYTSLNSTGDSGEFVQVACNQARSLIRNLVTLVSSDRISFECIAMSNDEGTFSSTRVASAIIEDVISRKNVDGSSLCY